MGKPDRENVIFKLLVDALMTYANNLHSCHDLWGNTGIEKYANDFLNYFRQFEEYRDKGKIFKSMNAEMGNKEGAVDAYPMDMKLATRLVNQSPAYVGMVNGFVGIFQSIDAFLKALVAKGDRVEAAVPKVGLDKAYTEMKRINHENFLQIIQVTAEYVKFQCGQHEVLSEHIDSNLPI